MKSESDISQVLAFLRQLELNNDRPWFKDHKDLYDSLRATWERDMERLIGLVAEFDDNAAGLAVKDCVYRIYRDVRFSKNKAPYKNYFSGVIGRGGRHTVMSGYYLHIQPDNIMIAGGIWWPEKNILTQLRNLIDAEADEFLKIIQNPEFTSRYVWQSDTLKTMPKDWPRTHPLEQFIKMKEYIVAMHLTEDYFDCDDWVERVAGDMRPMKPLHDFLNYVFD